MQRIIFHLYIHSFFSCFPWLAWANNFFHLTFDSISYGGIQKKWIQLLLRLNPRIINCVPFYQSRELRFVFIFPFMIGILSLLQDSENFDLVLIHRLCTDQWLWGLGSKNKPKNYKPIFFAVFPVLSNLCLQFLSFISALQTTLQKTHNYLNRNV